MYRNMVTWRKKNSIDTLYPHFEYPELEQIKHVRQPLWGPWDMGGEGGCRAAGTLGGRLGCVRVCVHVHARIRVLMWGSSLLD